jgi:hypothetical protein
MSTSPHKNWKGCAMCKPHKNRAAPRKHRDPVPVARKMGKRNYARHDLPDDGD